MPRINIEENWWTDPRRSRLIRLLGSEELADGCVIRAWRTALLHYEHERQLVPLTLFQCLLHHELLVEVGLAKITAEGVYLCGSKETFESWFNARQQRIEAGKRSAQARQKKYGTSQPNEQNKQVSQLINTERPFERARTTPNDSRTSYSFSDSDSDSNSKKKEKTAFANANDTNPDLVKPNLSGKFIAAYVAAYSKRYGEGTRPFLDGKTLGGIKRYLGSVGIERACDLIAAYCQMNDSWFVTKAHDFETFAQNQNKITLALDTGRMTTSQEAKGEERLDAIRQQMLRIRNATQS
jgi:hypothetical protein